MARNRERARSETHDSKRDRGTIGFPQNQNVETANRTSNKRQFHHGGFTKHERNGPLSVKKSHVPLSKNVTIALSPMWIHHFSAVKMLTILV